LAPQILEIKRRTLNEAQAARVTDLLARLDVVAEFVAGLENSSRTVAKETMIAITVSCGPYYLGGEF
jgi:hypothetical protein